MAIKVVTFDLDNTLWDVEPTLIAAERTQFAWLAQHYSQLTERFSKLEIREHRMAFWKSHPELAHQISELRVQSTRELLLKAGYGEEEASSGAIAAFEEFLQVRHQVEPYEEALEVLEALAELYTLGALTNGNADIFKVDIGACFDFAYTAEQVNASKPMPDMFHAALARTEVAPTELVHVGDNPDHDVGGAHAAGVFAVWLNASGEPWPSGRPPHIEINNLRELPAALQEIENHNSGKPG
jgi:2-haloalkanoic acid dehalogenase type II